MIPIDPLKSPAQDSILILSDIARKVQGKSAGEVGNMIVSGAVSLGLKIVCAAVIYAIGIWLIRKVRRLLHKVMEKKEMEPSLASFLSSAANVAMILVLTFIIIGILGINTTSIAALIASGGLALGMALSGALQNFAGGLMILAFKPFKVGDYIELQGGAAGYVQSITIISTYLRTTDNRIMIVPNGSIYNNTINNHSISGERRVVWEFSISYGDSVEKARETVIRLFEGDSRILSNRPIDVVMTSMDSSAIVLNARAWCKTDDYWKVFYHYNEIIYNAVPAAGLSFPYPHLTVDFDGNLQTPALEGGDIQHLTN